MTSNKNELTLTVSDSVRYILNDLELQYSDYFQYDDLSIFKPWRYHIVNTLKNSSPKHKHNFLRAKFYNSKNDWVQRRSVHRYVKSNKNNRSNSFQNTDIVFLLLTATHVKSCIPLLNYFDKKKTLSYKILCSTYGPAIHALDKSKRDYSILNSFLLDTNKIFRLQREFKRQLCHLGNVAFNLDKYNIFSMPHKEFISGKISSVVCEIDSLENMFHELNPSCLVVFNCDLSISSLAVQIAKRNSINTIYIQHGIFGHNIWNTSIDTDAVILSGESDKRKVKDLGCFSGNIFTVGRPIYDDIYHMKQKKKYLTFQPFVEGKPVIVFFTNPLSGIADLNENLEIYHNFLESAEQLSSYNFVVKLHPNDDRETRGNILTKYNSNGNIYEVQNEYDVYDIITNSDICITMFSTVGLEVILFDKPLITMNYGNHTDIVPYQGIFLTTNQKMRVVV